MAVVEPIPTAKAMAARSATPFALFQDRQPCRIREIMLSCIIAYRLSRLAGDARECLMPGSDLYQAIGGAAGCRKLSVAFYTRVDRDPVLRPFFPGKTLKCAIEAFAAYLAQFLGGPPEDA